MNKQAHFAPIWAIADKERRTVLIAAAATGQIDVRGFSQVQSDPGEPG